MGAAGSKGDVGPEGPTGITGPEGPIGPIGPKGTDGVDGTNGTNGNDASYENIKCTSNKCTFEGKFVHGPTKIKFSNGKCLDRSHFTSGKEGGNTCNNNDNQLFGYNPVTGHLMHIKSKECLENNGTNWIFKACSATNSKQAMSLTRNKLYNNGKCLDIGNNNRTWGCLDTNNNQEFMFQ